MIQKIRQLLKDKKWGALLVARTDSFLSEYYPPEKDCLKNLTGFSGSAGVAVITPTEKILFVDSRYTEQAKIESDFTVWEVPTQTTPSDWMKQNLSNEPMAYYPGQRSVLWVNYLEQKGVKTEPIDESIWQSLFPIKGIRQAKTFDYDLSYCGETTADKVKRVCQRLKELRLDAYVLTVPDSVSWLLNKRSLLVPQYPVIFERWVVYADGEYHKLSNEMTELSGKKVGLDLALAPVSVFQKIKAVATIVNTPDPVEQMKAIKNTVEQNNIRQACLFESRALCKFLVWVEQNKDQITESDCDQKLKELRAESPLYRGDSFETIAAVGEHAARAHYIATKESDVPVLSAPMLLVDTGGNYLNGTTDMTRTICVGKPTDLMKKRYTQVLKGHIALATTVVKQGDLPIALDQNARAFLRADGVDYGHSTGHGIGMYLAVHEAPPVIYEKSDTPLQPGMLFSNEPAYYDSENGFGIRLENMILTVAGPNASLILENLLWVPFDGRLIDFNLLTDSERGWLRSYHQGIRERIMPNLSDTEQVVLEPLLDFFK
ncbi:MAG: M24 family metallopeptidase [Alphaproteobacteria bacterium]|nr:M24 family metallopeptidase [Alphaproteobacteria bacterium]